MDVFFSSLSLSLSVIVVSPTITSIVDRRRRSNSREGRKDRDLFFDCEVGGFKEAQTPKYNRKMVGVSVAVSSLYYFSSMYS